MLSALCFHPFFDALTRHSEVFGADMLDTHDLHYGAARNYDPQPCLRTPLQKAQQFSKPDLVNFYFYSYARCPTVPLLHFREVPERSRFSCTTARF